MSPWSPGVSKIIGETQLSLGECGFAQLFEKEGFIDALPQGVARDVARMEAKERPLLEGGANEGAGGIGSFAALGAKLDATMDAKALPWQAFAMLETELTHLLLPPNACGKYDVSRQLEAAPSTLKQTPLLKAA